MKLQAQIFQLERMKSSKRRRLPKNDRTEGMLHRIIANWHVVSHNSMLACATCRIPDIVVIYRHQVDQGQV